MQSLRETSIFIRQILDSLIREKDDIIPRITVEDLSRLFTIKPASIELMCERIKLWRHKMKKDTFEHSSDLIYAKLNFLTTGNEIYLSSPPWPESKNPNLFELLYNYTTSSQIPIDEFEALKQLKKDMATSTIKVDDATKSILIKPIDRPETPKGTIRKSPISPQVKTREPIQSKSGDCSFKYKFLETTIPSPLFCSILDKASMDGCLISNCTPSDSERLTTLPPQEAWVYADKYYFRPWIKTRLSEYPGEHDLLPKSSEMIDIISTIISEKIKITKPEIPDLTLLKDEITEISTNIRNINDQLISLGTIEPELVTERPSFVAPAETRSVQPIKATKPRYEW